MKADINKILIFNEINKKHTLYMLFFILFLVLLSKSSYAATNPMLVRLVATGSSMQNECVVYFDSAASYNYEPEYDAPSLGVDPGALNIVTCFDGMDFQVKALPAITQNMALPLKISTGTTGTYLIYAGEMQNLPQGAALWLYDSYTATSFDLRGGAYSCIISDTETVSRFVLNIFTSVLQNVTRGYDPPTCAFSANGILFAKAPGSTAYDYYWKDSANNIIQVALNKSGEDTLYAINAGSYRVDVNTTGSNDHAVIYFNVEGSQSAKAHFSIANQQIYLSNGQATAYFTNTSQNSQVYWWDFGDGMGSPSQQGTNTYSQLGSYTVSLTCSNLTCPEVSTFSEVIEVFGGTTGIEAAENAFQVGFDGGGDYIIWNGNDGISGLLIWNMAGQVVESQQPEPGNEKKIYFSKQLSPNQVYVVQTTTGNGLKTLFKFIKQ